MWRNQQFPADLVTFTEKILIGKLHFLCSVRLVSGDNLVLYFSTISWLRLHQETVWVNINYEKKTSKNCTHWNINIQESKFLYEKMSGSVGWNKHSGESSINQNSNNTISVTLCTGATFVKENPCLAARIVSFDTAGLSTYFPYFWAIFVQRYWAWSQSSYLTLMALL